MKNKIKELIYVYFSGLTEKESITVGALFFGIVFSPILVPFFLLNIAAVVVDKWGYEEHENKDRS